MKAAITTLMFTGMRVGEWLALTWEQVDFHNNVITIDRAITKACEYNEDGSLKDRKTVVGDTKTQCSIRKIKVSPVVMDVLREWQKALPGHVRSPAKSNLLSAKSVVFPNNMGQNANLQWLPRDLSSFHGRKQFGKLFSTQLPPHLCDHAYGAWR